MNVLLVHPQFRTENIRPPLGLAYLAAVLENRHKIRILDLSLYPESDAALIQTLKTFKPDIVGVTCYTPLYSSAMKVAALTKEHNPNILVVMGGPHPTILPETCLKDSVDFVIRGEGEYTFPELLNSLDNHKGLKGINGLSFKKNGKIVHNANRPYIEDLDSLPFPARHYLELERYVDHMDGKKFTTMLTSRGCPYNCIYCCKNIVGKRWAPRSPENVILEIEEIIHKYNFRHIHFHEELFTFRKEWVTKVCELLITKKLNITWSCSSRVDLVTLELLQLMKRAGCTYISYGVESGDEQVLKSLKKGITIEQVKKTFKYTHEAGITSRAYFMIGAPEDTPKTIQKTINLALELDPDYVQFSVVTPYPGTELWENAKKEGMLKDNFTWDDLLLYNKSILNTKNLTGDEILKFFYSANNVWNWHIFKRTLHKNPTQLLKLFVSKPTTSLSKFLKMCKNK